MLDLKCAELLTHNNYFIIIKIRNMKRSRLPLFGIDTDAIL